MSDEKQAFGRTMESVSHTRIRQSEGVIPLSKHLTTRRPQHRYLLFVALLRSALRLKTSRSGDRPAIASCVAKLS
jgi:hypothetical protein